MALPGQTGQGGDHGTISQPVNTNGKAELPVPGVIARGCQCNGEGVPRPKGECLLGVPVSFALKGAHSSFDLVKDGLYHSPVPKLGLGAMCQTLLPLCGKLFDSTLPVLTLPNQVDEGQVLVAQRTFALLTMLVEGPECSGCLVTCGFLQLPTYCPVQLLFEVVAALVPGQPQQALPAEFFIQLLEQNWPAIF